MFFHIDESGNSGNNLFDKNQPVLSYGVLSSRWDVDAHGLRDFERILGRAGVRTLHASRLGVEGLEAIGDELASLHRAFDFRFDYYFIHKPSFAVATFFNAVFDAGLNDAMKWDWYWTPLRFPLIALLNGILTEDALRESWRLCLVPKTRIAREKHNIIELLSQVLTRLESSAIQPRPREILSDALRFGLNEPLKLDFGIYSPTALSPNTVGFQFVLTALASRQKALRQKALGITVDWQAEFNSAQIETYDVKSKMAIAFRASDRDRKYLLAHPFLEGAREDFATLITHFPEKQVQMSRSAQSPGLQLSDTYLWLLNRHISGRTVPRSLLPVIWSAYDKGLVDGISVAAMMRRWDAFEAKLPAFADVTPEQRVLAQKLVDEHRQRVRDVMCETRSSS